MTLSNSDIRKDFPTLVRHDTDIERIHYLDNAATALKPQVVLDALHAYNVEYPANIHRGSHYFSQKASDAYEEARERVARFLGVKSPGVIFTSGTTASCNLFARSFLGTLKPGDEILITSLEHNSNLVPWRVLCAQYGLKLNILPFDVHTGKFDLDLLVTLLTPNTKLFSFTLASNTLGTIPPFKEMIRLAKDRGILCALDIAQAVSHFPVHLEEWNVDVAYFSGHKIFAPTGIGVLYVKESLLKTLPPFFVGGGMVLDVSPSEIIFTPHSPERFEAGTPPIAQAIGLGAAIQYMETLGWETITALETQISKRFEQLVASLPGLTFYAQDEPHVCVFSFNIPGIHAHDVASIFDQYNVAVRSGQHCTHLLLNSAGIAATVRASLAFYNNEDDILALRNAITTAKEVFHVS